MQEDPLLIYWLYAGGSAVFFLITCLILSPKLSSILCPGYNKLEFNKRIDWDSRVTSNIHAVIVSFRCVYAFVADDNLDKEPVWSDSPIVYINCSIVIGYMIADLIVILLYYKYIGDCFYLFHHSASIYAYCFNVYYGVFSYFANFRLLAELSTVFVNQRWFMDALKKPKTSAFFVANGLILVAVFFLSRILVMPYYWYKVVTVYGTPGVEQLYLVLVSSCVILDVMNLVWFYKLLKGAIKVLRGFYTPPKEKSN